MHHTRLDSAIEANFILEISQCKLGKAKKKLNDFQVSKLLNKCRHALLPYTPTIGPSAIASISFLLFTKVRRLVSESTFSKSPAIPI
eukprot:Gb_40989 [translate_table: standard]